MEAAASACSTMGRLISSSEQLRPRSVRIHALANDKAAEQSGEVKRADRARRAFEKAAAYRKKLLSKSSGEQSDIRYENSGDEQAIGEEEGKIVQPGVAGEDSMEGAQIKTHAMALEKVEGIDEPEDSVDKRARTGLPVSMGTTQPEVAKVSGVNSPFGTRQSANTEKGLALGRDEIIVKIYSRDGVIVKKAKPDPSFAFGAKRQEKEPDGLRSLENRKFGEPGSLNAGVTAPPRKLPEMGRSDGSENQSGEDLYQPKVSTWGMFPRPANISKTFGGGRVIKPGEQYDQNPEQKRAREEAMKQLVGDERKRMGLDIPPAVALECQQMIDKADALATDGRRLEALECLDFVLKKVVYESDLHGEAAIQKAICLESMNRSSEARIIFKKLSTHSKFEVRRSAKRMLYTYKAAEKLRFSEPASSGASAYYQKFFDMLLPADYKRYNSYRPSKTEAPDFELKYDEVLLSMMVMLTPFTIIVGLVLKRRFL